MLNHSLLFNTTRTFFLPHGPALYVKLTIPTAPEGTYSRRGNFEGPEPERLATLKYAAMRGAPYVDVEYKSAAIFFAGEQWLGSYHTPL